MQRFSTSYLFTLFLALIFLVAVHPNCFGSNFTSDPKFMRTDFDGDHDVDGVDLALCSRFFGAGNYGADFNGDNTLDILDVAFFSESFGIDNYLDAERFAYVYEVGPGKEYLDPSDVPWEALKPGSLVLIYYRDEPYASKWVIAVAGTEEKPIVVRGVPRDGKLPVITGENASTRLNLDFWNENRSVIKIGGSSYPSEFPEFIRIENLDIKSARPPFSFLDDRGNTRYYSSNAASIHVEMGNHIIIRNCILHDSGNGFFAGSQSSDLLLEGNYIYDNGIEGSIYEHNNYTECLGIVFQFNHFGPLRQGCRGNNLKDRSAGTVIRYNWIEAGNRTIDLVESDHENLINDPSYRNTYVYGNVLIKHDVEENGQVLHYGGDGGDYDKYRKGTLWFYNNTVVSYRSGNTTLIGISTNDETVEAFNNIVYTTASGYHLAVMGERGVVEFYNNWIKEGWRVVHGSLYGSFTQHDNLADSFPEFSDFANKDFTLSPDSSCIDSGTVLPAYLLPLHGLTYEYNLHQKHSVRSNDGTIDMGAFERFQVDNVKGEY